MHARARTAATRWLGCCGNRYSVDLPDTRMSMTLSACGTIRRCAGSSAAKPSWAVRLRRARLAALRRNGLLQTRTFLVLPTCPANGSTLCQGKLENRYYSRQFGRHLGNVAQTIFSMLSRISEQIE